MNLQGLVKVRLTVRDERERSQTTTGGAAAESDVTVSGRLSRRLNAEGHAIVTRP